MTSYIVDRRLNGKHKSAVNRQRFLRRYRKHIKKAVSEAVNKRSITDIESGESISIPSRDISEPVFHHGAGGKRYVVHPGNKEFVAGDRVKRPEGGGGGGSGSGEASDSGEGMDDFVFEITQEEFLDFMFEDLELPNLVKKQLTDSEATKTQRAGFSNEGTPNQLNLVRSMRSANARRIAVSSSNRKKIKRLEEELKALRDQDEALKDKDRIAALEEQIEGLHRRIERIPFIDTFDLKYNLNTQVPVPSSKAVMFCIMDVSGSMDQATKDIAKRFFILLYLFLQRNYDKTEVVFIRHHTSAKEVDEQEFFYSRETGGTIVSSALKLMGEIADQRYPAQDWNIYAAQASDGDNWNNDSSICSDLIRNKILPLVQHYSYIEITPREHQSLWHEYEAIAQQFQDSFAMRQIIEASDIYPVFRALFERRAAYE